MADSRIAVLGAGANGASIAADLVDAGLDPLLIEQWPAHVATMRADGLRVVQAESERTVRPRVIDLCQVAEVRGEFDIVLMLMKAYDATWAAHLVAPLLARDGLLIGVQNGMTSRTIASAVGAHRTLGAVIECSATMTVPGVVHRHTGVERSWFAVGALDGGPQHRVAETAALLRHAGDVVELDDIESAKWMKLVSNATLLVSSAILGLPMLDALHTPDFRAVMIAAGEEALSVGGALGYRALPIFGLSEAEVSDRSRIVEVMTDKLFAGFVVPGATTTVLQDWRKGRRSEARELNGLVSQQGRAVGIATPVNDRILEIAVRIEAGAHEPALDHLRALVDVTTAARVRS